MGEQNINKPEQKKVMWEWGNSHKPELTCITIVILLALGIAGLIYLPKKNVSPVQAFVEDSIRHYPPVLRGDKLYISCRVVNMSEHDQLVITDIQPDNFSIELLSHEHVIVPPGKSEVMRFVYYAEKVLGKTEHTIRLFGNVEHTGVMQLTFDTHVVRPANDQSDYEDIFFQEKQSKLEELVDGELGEKGYTPDSAAHAYSVQQEDVLKNRKK